MKTQKKNNKGLYLQMRNNRWKWMAGATAVTAAGVTASQASTITISLVNNYISALEGNHLNADLTGDGHPDLTLANARHVSTSVYRYNGGIQSSARVNLNGVMATAASVWFSDFFVRLGSQFKSGGYGNSSKFLSGSIPIFFKDLHINGGAPTRGSLEVTVSASGNDAAVQLDSLTYNTPGPGPRLASVPDGGSSLALLAMGAGGVLAFRRWRVTQQRS